MIRTYIIFIFIILFSIGCKKPFEHEAISDSASLLVVEGIINTSGQTNIYLSRTLKLAEKTKVNNETKASVQIEGENNIVFPLTESAPGIYSANTLNLNANQQYRLRIKTTAGKEYLSDRMSVLTTPAIDSVNWVREKDGVGIYVNTHDKNNNTKYYQWDYEETWEIESSVFSELVYKDNKMQNRSPLEIPLLYTCWKNLRSEGLLLFSTAKLSSDVVYSSPLVFIPNRNEKLGVKYSVLVKQYAIGRSGYEYLSLMKKNSEQQGSFFDIQPSEINGNIKCITDPNELVIGYLSISRIVEKRIFINSSQVPKWNFNMICTFFVVRNRSDSLDVAFGHGQNVPTSSNLGSNGLIESYNGGTADCIDCRIRGGSNNKPVFW